MVWVGIGAGIIVYFVIGAILMAALGSRAAALCHDHYIEDSYRDYRSQWWHCEPSVCTKPEARHRIDRNQLKGWLIGLFLGWPVAVLMLMVETRTITVANAVDPAVRRSLEVRTAYLEKQLEQRGWEG